MKRNVANPKMSNECLTKVNEDQFDHNADESKDNTAHSYTVNEIKWNNVFWLIVFHLLALYGAYLYIIGSIKWQSAIACYLFAALSGIGVTAGAHRLWSHRSYKAKLPFRLFLVLCNTMAHERDIYNWCRDHRVHHKYSETNADPHNSNRGFFFAHMGWLMLKKHPEVLEKGSKIDMSDVWADPTVRFQRRHYTPLVILCWGLIPTIVPYYCWDESLGNSFLFCVAFRYVYMLHVTWNVNSFAHMFGNQPYNRNIRPRENQAITYITYGEGYHNYHHTFPWDYSASEFGSTANYNVTTMVIDLAAKLGLAYDLRKPTQQSVVARIEKSGDNSYDPLDHAYKSMTITVVDWCLGLFTSALFILILIVVRLIVVCLK